MSWFVLDQIIAHTISVASCYMANPRKAHWQATKWILRYLKGTTNIGLVFGRGTNGVNSHVTRFYDLGYAGDLDRRRSLTCYIFMLGGSAISCLATLQSIIA